MPTALVTGASSGIGYDLATILARHGHDLVLVARGHESMQRLANQCVQQFGVRCSVIVEDLSQPAAGTEIVRQLHAHFTPIDILINNAGFGSYGPFARTDLQVELKMVQVNVIAAIELTRLLLPGMIQRRAGRILNVASMAGFVPGPYMSTYYATKAFLVSHSLALRTELRRHGITVTALCPGPVHTGFQQRAGMTASRLFRLGAATSISTAEAGYAGMMRGRALVIPGIHNRLGVALSRLLPQTLLARIAARMNGNPDENPSEQC